MCDVNPEKLSAEEVMVSRRNDLSNSVCMKCKEVKAVVIVRGQDPLCRTCFLTYTTHKFRSTLGKSKLIKADDKVLLALSSGQSSTAMLHLVKQALSEGAHKRLKFSPALVFVNEHVTIGDEFRYDTLHVEDLARHFGYPLFCEPVHKGFCLLADGDNDESKFVRTLNTITSLTSKVQFIEHSRLSVICGIARQHGYTKILMGDNATHLAMKILTNMAEGNGATIPLVVGVADTRYHGLTIIRPMRELTNKEVALYNRLQDVSVHPLPNILTKKPEGSCIQRKTEEFINNLQNGFPSTVATVFRTGDKLCVHSQASSASCVLCQRTLDGSEQSYKATNDMSSLNHESTTCSSCDCGISLDSRQSTSEVQSNLCYGCNTIFKEAGYRVELLPRYAQSEIATRANRSKLRSQIEDFLIE